MRTDCVGLGSCSCESPDVSAWALTMRQTHSIHIVTVNTQPVTKEGNRALVLIGNDSSTHVTVLHPFHTKGIANTSTSTGNITESFGGGD